LGRIKRFRQLLAPLLLLLLELLRLLLTVLLLQPLELGAGHRTPFFPFFPLQLLPRLLLTPFLLFLPLLLDGAKPGGLGHPPRNERSPGLLVHRTGIPRSPVTTRPITYGDRVPSTPDRGARGLPLALGSEVLRPTLATMGQTHPPGDGAGRSQRQSVVKGRRSL